MRAAVLHALRDLRLEERPIPRPGAGEVLVRVTVCGVCGTDAIEWDRGLLSTPPVVLGHEFTGVVEQIGEGVSGLRAGATVVCGAGISCGACRQCSRGRTNLCRTYRTAGLQVDGGLAGYVVVPAAILLDVSEAGLPNDTLALAQPMSIAVHVVRRSGLRAGDEAVIVGVGGIGAFLVVAAAATGARVTAVARDPERLALAGRLGAADGIRAGEIPLADALRQRGVQPDVLFEVSATAEGLADVLGAAPRGAVVVPVGVQKVPTSLALRDVTLDEIAIVGSVAHVFADDMPEAVKLLATRADWSDVAGEVIPLDLVVERALRPLLEGTASQIKTLVDPWAEAPRPARHRR
ncbi:alcohol dehydrogenase catalytic domain-containing protein [Microbacterium sp. BK668]|uniref:zinc-dependent alcohol dehydrogenase n=1 Tax=Microbacterium sp. BK668 TaxID=2512118 RepID=UPI0010619536|nr:alcohol dehydrogenase catalytic domain-containing protein [Microbacterium sp. BK668]TDN92164.1 (R,R)-butanediol dehydrogenase/meso-butanediol dehydrogenase/diacetyl reductase/L-iditol 2-dehydrogenase/L-idonate 5-dehydrogenase [Microbacterium sp. BK668]